MKKSFKQELADHYNNIKEWCAEGSKQLDEIIKMQEEKMKNTTDEYLTIKCTDLTDDEKREMLFKKIELTNIATGEKVEREIIGYSENKTYFNLGSQSQDTVIIKNPDYQPPVKSVFDRCQKFTVVKDKRDIGRLFVTDKTDTHIHLSDGSSYTKEFVGDNYEIISGGKE